MVQSDVELLTLVRPALERGRTWPTDGTEHMFFYTMEKLTGRGFIHGEIVGMGSVVAAFIQKDDVSSVIKDLDSFGLHFRPADNGISFEDFERTIANMKRTSEAMGIRYVALDEYEFQKEDAKQLWRVLSS
jgi:glycerol-1-phosphate dehydrogenase [NAD(P)+]